jgi:hypothetical protein
MVYIDRYWMSVAILLTQTIKKSPQPYNLWRPSNVMAVSYTLNRFITAKKSDVAFNTTNCCCNQREKILRFFLNRFCNCKPVDKNFFYTNNIINCIKKNPGGGRAVTTGTKFFFQFFGKLIRYQMLFLILINEIIGLPMIYEDEAIKNNIEIFSKILTYI